MQFAEVVGVGQVALLYLERGQFGAVVLDDVGQDSDRLAGQLGGLVLLAAGLGQSFAGPVNAQLPLKLRRRTRTGRRVSDAGRVGDDEQVVGVHAAGRDDIGPLAGLGPGDQAQAFRHSPALR